jgi:mannonate dehydratase
MRFAEVLTEPAPTPHWHMFRQIGVDAAVIALPRHFADWRQTRGDLPWDYTPLALYKDMVEREGFTVEVVEDNPPMEAIRYGRPGRDEEIEHVCKLLRNMGRLGIGAWVYGWSPSLGWVRTATNVRERGGAIVSAYDHRVLDHAEPSVHGPIDAEALWENLAYFLERVIPVAEEAGVRLAMHPDDPPLPSVRGTARIMCTPEGFQRLIDLHPSEANAITFCQGNFTLMTDDLPGLIRDFGGQGRIAFVHFRDVVGTAEAFTESFHDNGRTDMLACMRAYADIAFEGVMRPDHVPMLAGDDVPAVVGYAMLGRLHAIGYMTGLREAALSDATGEDV